MGESLIGVYYNDPAEGELLFELGVVQKSSNWQ